MAEKIKAELVDGLNRKVFFAPREWNDMSRRELVGWAGILRLELSRDEALNAAIVLLYGVNKKLFASLPSGILFGLRETLVYLEQNGLTRNVLGNLRIMGRKFYGPGHKLANVSISEYRRTEIYYQLYQQFRKKEFLFLLAATLWRPKGGRNKDDVRADIDERSLQKRANLFSWAMNDNVLHAIKLFYEGCRSYIINQHPEVYPVSNGEEQVNPLAQQQKRTLIDLEDHILAYSGGKLGTYEETARSGLFLFLKHMSQKLQEMDRVKK